MCTIENINISLFHNNKDMEKILVKEHVIGFVMIAGVLKDETFKAKNGIKFNTKFLTKDEQLFDNDFSARRHADMLNNVID